MAQPNIHPKKGLNSCRNTAALQKVMTAREKQIWQYIKTYRKAHGFGPSWGEICQEFNLNPGSVQWCINQMVAKGKIRRLYDPNGSPISHSIEAI